MYVHDFIPPVTVGPIVSFLVWRRIEKNNTRCKFWFTVGLLHRRIYNFNGVWVLIVIFLSLSCNLVLWCELNKNSQSFFVYFCFPILGHKKESNMAVMNMMTCSWPGLAIFFKSTKSRFIWFKSDFFLFKSIFFSFQPPNTTRSQPK